MDSTAATRQHLFQATVARNSGSGWWLMNHKDKGWSSFGYPYKTVLDIQQDWAVTFGQLGTDAHGDYIEVLPAREAP